MLLLLVAQFTAAQVASSTSVPAEAMASTGQGPVDPAELESFVDGFFAKNLEEMHIPGAVFVMVKDGEVFFSKAYGYADLEKQVPADPEQTIYRIASVSKLFTATAAMQLVEGGLLELDADINRYLTNFQIPDTYSQPVTLARLLTHTAGFEDQVIGTVALSEAELIPLGDYLAAHTPSLVNPPGSIHSYSNYSLALAGYLVEEVAGVPFAQYVDENILRPLGMEHTTFLQPLPPDLVPKLATGYYYRDGFYEPAHDFAYLQEPPEGAMSATASDIARFMIAHLQDGRYKDTRILEESTARQMHRRQFTHHPELPGMGYGFKERFINGRRVIGHGGDIGTYSSQMILDPEQNEGFYVAYNIMSDALREDLIAAFYDHYYPLPTEPAPIQVLSMSPGELSRFDGAYRYVRHSQTTLGKVAALMPGVLPWSIRANGDGTLSLALFGLDKDWRYAPVEPLVFKQVSGTPVVVGGIKIDPGETLAFREDASHRITFAFIPIQNAALEKLAWYESSGVQLATLGILLSVFFSAVIIWPLRAVIDRLRRRTPAATPASRRARWLAGIVSGLNFIFVPLVVLSAGNLMFGISPLTRAALTIPIITGILSLVLLGMTVLAWKDGYWSVPGRVYYSCIALASVVFVLWVNYWNLLGWRY